MVAVPYEEVETRGGDSARDAVTVFAQIMLPAVFVGVFYGVMPAAVFACTLAVAVSFL